MYHLLLVHVLHSSCHLPNDYRSCLLAEPVPVRREGEEVAVGGELEQEIDVGLIAEAAVEGDQGGVVEEGLDFDLPHLLVYGLLRFLLRLAEQALLADDLQRGQKASLPVPGYP